MFLCTVSLHVDVRTKWRLAAIVTMENPYYGGFWFLIKKLQKLSRWNSLLSPSGPIHALWPNFGPIACELSEKIAEKKKEIKKETHAL